MSGAQRWPAALLQEVLDVYRQPLRYRSRWADPAYALPEDVGDLLDLALAPPETLAGPAEQLHADPGELARAIRFFIHQALLAEGGDPYRILGLTPAATPHQIRSHYRKLMRLYHPDRALGDEWGGVCAPRINRAYAELRRPQAGRCRPAPPAGQIPAAGAEPGRCWGGPARPGPAGRQPWKLVVAASCAAVAAGAGFIVWNLLAWSAPAEWPRAATPAPAASRPGAAPPAPAAEAPALNEQELQTLVLDRLVASYRRGDIDAFIALFSEHAVSNRQSGRESIRREYAEFFASTARRELRLDGFHWQIDHQTALGEGTFNLKLSVRERNMQPNYQGILILDVAREPEAPLIRGFFQSYRGVP